MDLSGFSKRTKNYEIAGRTLCFTQLTVGDFIEARAWAQEKHEQEVSKKRKSAIEIAKSIGEIQPLELMKYIDTSLSEDALDKFLETPEGGCYLLWLSVKQKHPDISHKQLMAIVDIQSIPELIEFAVGFGSDNNAEKKSILQAAIE
jgi:hypothetical protein